MPYSGEGRKKIVIIAECPGEIEDNYNRQLVGTTGDWLYHKLQSYGYDLYKDFWLINSVNCRCIDEKGSNRNPTPLEVNHCRPYVESVLNQLQPKAILMFGEATCRSFFSSYFGNNIQISQWESLAIPSRKHNAWLLPLFHPQYAIRNQKDENLQAYFDISLRNALDKTEEPFPVFDDYTTKIKNLYNIDDICSLLQNVIDTQPPLLFHDYETSGIKPHKPGHKIASMSFALTPDIAYSFPYQYRHYYTKEQQIRIKSLWRKILSNPKIGKAAHGLKFEYSWGKNIFGVEMQGRQWCTMDAAHIEDGRFKYTGLKKQAFIHFGIPPYNNHIEPYLESTDSNGFNRVDEIDLEELLTYGNYDSLLGRRLIEVQKRTLDDHHEVGCGSLKEAREFFLEVGKCYMEMSERGFPSDIEYYKKEKQRIQTRIAELKEEIRNSEEAKSFFRAMGREVKIGKQLSDDDLRVILFDIMKLPPHKLTDSGNKVSVDSDSLERIDLPFVTSVVDLKHNVKVDSNYINGFIRETALGAIHCSINLHIPRSLRSSVDSPNLQNVPTREEMAKKSTRSGMFPSKGRQLLFADFKGIEVCVAAMYSGDKNLIRYITDPTSDMHKDKASELWVLDHDRVSKDIRFYAKNKWVFAQFYGDWYGACAEQLWFFCLHLKTTDGVKLEDHLINIGMISRNDHPSKQLESFKQHCKTVEHKMWNEQFGAMKEWQINLGKEYRKKGYVTLKHGFRRGGLQSMNQIGNTPIQGCLQGGVLVQTNKGWVPIKKLVDVETEVWTGFNWAKAIGINRGESKLAIIELESGLEIHCDVRHRLKNVRNEWVDFNKLCVGDYVALPRISFERIESRKEITWPFVLGFIIGDGCFCSRYNKGGTKAQYYLSIYGDEVKKEVLEQMSSFLNSEGFNSKIRTIEEVGYNDKYSIDIYQNKIFDKLTTFGMEVDLKAKTKKIPSKVWEMEPQDQIDFLNGLWLSDGSRSDKSLHMSNLNLLKDIQILSYGLGYDSYFVKTKAEAYKLDFRQVERDGYKYNGRSNRIYPVEAVNQFMKGKIYRTYGNRSNEQIANARALRSKGNISQTTAERIIEEINPDYEIYRYDKIKYIDILNEAEETFTMSVDDELHQFVADGVIHQNTASHLLAKTITESNLIFKRNKTVSELILQIHDEMICNLHPPEYKYVRRTLDYVGTQKIREDYDWINVPLTLEFEMCSVDSPWYYKTEIDENGVCVKKGNPLYQKMLVGQKYEIGG
jgi:uracil-DNA glycosylase family 4